MLFLSKSGAKMENFSFLLYLNGVTLQTIFYKRFAKIRQKDFAPFTPFLTGAKFPFRPKKISETKSS